MTKNTLLLLCVLGTGLAVTPAHAKTGKCVLQVKGKTFLNGPCNVLVTDKQGSFSVGVSDTHRSKYFAYVNMEDDGAHGYWNETPSATHAQTELGILKRDGACWKNDTARICAYK